MKIGFIGTGNMGGALAQAAAQAIDPAALWLANRTVSKTERLAAQLGAKVSDNLSIAAQCDYIFLGVKPQMMEELLSSLHDTLSARRTPCVLISMATGLTVAALQAMAGLPLPVIRIMPNIACAVGAGLTLYAKSAEVTAEQEACLHTILSASGVVEPLEEGLMDAASTIAGCGTAFACLFMEALADGGVICGLPRDKASAYAQQMLLGAARLAQTTGKHPGALKDDVCSPGGTTIVGVRALEEGGFRSAAMNAVIAAYDRTMELKK